jgi:hypothetical protein
VFRKQVPKWQYKLFSLLFIALAQNVLLFLTSVCKEKCRVWVLN